jgi:hypothetical protein
VHNVQKVKNSYKRRKKDGERVGAGERKVASTHKDK